MTQLLVAATWLGWVAAAVGIGRLVALRLRPTAGLRGQFQMSLWLGLWLLVFSAVVMNFVWGMSYAIPTAFAALWLVVGIGSLAVWAGVRRAKLRGIAVRTLSASNIWGLLLLMVTLGAIALLAGFATAEPMDYDAGLYRLGIINYAVDYPAIPGLANLHDRFGFNSFLGPLAGLLDHGLWDGQGYRIITGLFVTMLFVDVITRVTVPRRRTAGDFFAVLGAGFTMWVILPDSGRWVPSPGQDVMALVLVVVFFAYLADYVRVPTREDWHPVVFLSAAALAGSVRPLAWTLVPLALVAVWVSDRRIKGIPSARRPVRRDTVIGTALAGLLLLAMLARDAVLSGWLLFPSSFWALPVDWLAPDPSGTRAGITWYARAGKNMGEAQESGWFGDWATGFSTSHEARGLAILLVAAALPVLWRSGRQAWRGTAGGLAIALTPAVILTVLWFVTAPDPRFNWGGLFAVAALPISMLLSAGAYPRWTIRLAFVMVLAFGLVTNIRNGRFEPRGRAPEPVPASLLGIPVELSLGAPNQVATVSGQLGDGTAVQFPAEGENCYMEFPLCLLPGTGSTVEMRGRALVEGFRQR